MTTSSIHSPPKTSTVWPPSSPTYWKKEPILTTATIRKIRTNMSKKMGPCLPAGLDRASCAEPHLSRRPRCHRKRDPQREAVLAKGSPEADREPAKWIVLQDRLSKENVPTYFPLQYTSEHQDTTAAESIDLSHYPYSFERTAAWNLKLASTVVVEGARISSLLTK